MYLRFAPKSSSTRLLFGAVALWILTLPVPQVTALQKRNVHWYPISTSCTYHVFQSVCGLEAQLLLSHGWVCSEVRDVSKSSSYDLVGILVPA